MRSALGSTSVNFKLSIGLLVAIEKNSFPTPQNQGFWIKKRKLINQRNKCAWFEPNQTIFEVSRLPRNSYPCTRKQNFCLQAFGQTDRHTNKQTDTIRFYSRSTEGWELDAFFSRNAGVSAVTVANNHLLDFGEQGANNTLNEIRKFGIIPSGFTMGKKIYNSQVELRIP